MWCACFSDHNYTCWCIKVVITWSLQHWTRSNLLLGNGEVWLYTPYLLPHLERAVWSVFQWSNSGGIHLRTSLLVPLDLSLKRYVVTWSRRMVVQLLIMHGVKPENTMKAISRFKKQRIIQHGSWSCYTTKETHVICMTLVFWSYE